MRPLAILLSFGVGFLSLSQEIMWVRIVSLAHHGRPHAFSMVLVAFLVGIALGSMIGRKVCERSRHLLRTAGWILVVAAVADIASLYVCTTQIVVPPQGSPRLLLLSLLPVFLGAALKGILFPIAHHLGAVSDERRVGRSVSHVYLANVLGSTLGPIVTGFWLLDRFPVETVFGLIALGTAALGSAALWAASGLRRGAWLLPASALGLAALAVLRPPGVVERIAREGQSGTPIRYLAQNKHGVIHVLAEEQPGLGDVTYGGNAYDGRISVDTRVNSNEIERAYVVATLHPRPRRAMIVGLSSGAWATVILGIPGIEHVDIVEINPGYLDLIARYPDVAPVLRDPRVRIHIDDGRRWLRAHPQERYDLIFQNTTFHWRAYGSLMLSKEYFGQLERHLADGGIVATNTTGSLDAFHTAAHVFPHVARYKNFVYMSKAPLVRRADSEAVLRQCRVWNRPAFDDSAFLPGGIGASLVHDPLESGQAYLARVTRGRTPFVISDLNMIPEYRHGAAPPFDSLRSLLPRDTGRLSE